MAERGCSRAVSLRDAIVKSVQARSGGRRKGLRVSGSLASGVQCGKLIRDANRLERNGTWARKFCGNTCRQSAFQARNG